MTRQEYEKLVQRLVGHKLAKVFYYEINYKDKYGEPQKEPAWNWDSRFDSLDFGLDLVTDTDETFWVTWGWEFFNYNISVEVNPVDDRSAMRQWNTSEVSRWYNYIGKQITDVYVYWAVVEYDGNNIEYPQDLELIFGSGLRVYLSALEIWCDSGRSAECQDHITVVFDEDVARSFRISRYAMQSSS